MRHGMGRVSNIYTLVGSHYRESSPIISDIFPLNFFSGFSLVNGWERITQQRHPFYGKSFSPHWCFSGASSFHEYRSHALKEASLSWPVLPPTGNHMKALKSPFSAQRIKILIEHRPLGVSNMKWDSNLKRQRLMEGDLKRSVVIHRRLRILCWATFHLYFTGLFPAFLSSIEWEPSRAIWLACCASQLMRPPGFGIFPL